MVKSNNQKQYKNWKYNNDGNPEYWKYLSQKYYRNIGELEAIHETKKTIHYEALTKESAITHKELDILSNDIGRIQYIRIGSEGKIIVCVKKKEYNEITGIYEVIDE